MFDLEQASHLEFVSAPHAATFIARALHRRRRPFEAGLAPTPSARWAMAEPWSAVAAPARAPVLDGWRLPEVMVPHLVSFRLALALLSHPASGMSVWRTVQVRTRLRQLVPIQDVLAVEMHASLSEAQLVPRGRERVVRVVATQAGSAAWESETAFLERDATASPRMIAAPSPPPEVRGDVRATMHVPRNVRWHWARLSGDYNPIHLADWYARGLGYRRAFSQPLFVAGAALRQSWGARADELFEVTMWFRGPIYYGLPVQVIRERAETGDVLGLRADDEGRLAVIARTQRSAIRSG